MPADFRPPPPPVNVPTPVGWEHLPDSKSSPDIVKFAQGVLAGGHPYGYFEETTINGHQYAAIVEPHWDNHVSANYKWHPGVSILKRSSS
jgi:hypothetical protein